MPGSVVKSLPLLVFAAMLGGCGDDSLPSQPETAAGASTAQAASGVTVAAAAVPTASNTWVTRATMTSAAITGITAGMAPNSAGVNIVYTFGGTNFEDEGGTNFPIQAYNTVTNVWTVKKTTVPFSTRFDGVANIGNLLYYSGGWVDEEPGDGYGDELTAYDYVHDVAIAKAHMPKHVADGITGVIGNIIYVLPGTCGGEGWPFVGWCGHEEFRRLFRYNTATDAWGTRTLAPHFHIGGAGAAINGKFYVAAGHDSAAHRPSSQLDVYDPATNHWRTLAPMPGAGNAIGTQLGGKLYVITRDRHLYVYNPATNTWATKRSPPAAAGLETVALVVIKDQLYLFTVGTHGAPSALYKP